MKLPLLISIVLTILAIPLIGYMIFGKVQYSVNSIEHLKQEKFCFYNNDNLDETDLMQLDAWPFEKYICLRHGKEI